MFDTTTHALPASCDLRPLVNDIEDQGPIGACTANAGATVFDILSERAHEKYPSIQQHDFSRLYLYYWTRNFEGRIGQDGANPADVWEVLSNKGACLESSWPYDISQQNTQPPISCDIEAQGFKVLEYASLMAGNNATDWPLAAPLTLTRIKHALCQGRPVEFSFNVTQDFINQGYIAHDWRTFTWQRMPTANNPIVASHACVFIGYDDATGRLLAQNSWSHTWGDGGFLGVPYDALGDYFYGVSTAFCSLYDTIGAIPGADYLPIVWDQARAAAIRATVNSYLDPITALAKQYGVPAAEIDAAMPWAPGTSALILKI